MFTNVIHESDISLDTGYGII